MIRLEHLSKVYSGNQTVALSDFTLTIEPGEFITIVGPSGCGKTTLLNLLAGFEKPSGGTITIHGEPVTGPSPARTMVFQQATLLPWMNVRDNIAFGLRIQKGARKVDFQRVQEFIEIMGLKGFEKHKVYELSGGMQQRVAIARALITLPQVILMDEPFGALDAMTRAELQQFLLRLWERLNSTIVFITHDIDEAILLGNRVLVMTPRPGRLAKDIPVHFPQSRDENILLSPSFMEIKREITALLHPNKAQYPGIPLELRKAGER